MRRCAKCVLPNTVPGIVFDAEGVCSFCRSYEGETYLGRDEFEKIVASAKARGAKYDCIVPLSGGRDSSFVLYAAKARHNLNVLAANYDHEFRNPAAVANMQRACERLNVDFAPIRSRRDIAGKILRCRIRAAEEWGMYGLSNAMCIACSYGYRSIVYRLAEQHRVPLILWGSSQAENTERMKKKAFGAFRRSVASFPKTAKMRLYKRLAAIALFLQRLEFPVRGNSLFRKERPVLRNPDIAEIAYFDYMEWDPREIEDVITNELGWVRPQGHVSSWRTDCLLHPAVDFAFFRLFGCTSNCFGYARMINAGKMTREKALAQEEETAARFQDDRAIRDLLERDVGLSAKEVERIFLSHETMKPPASRP